MPELELHEAQAALPEPPEAPAALSDLEVEVIDLFVSAVKLLGIAKSVGEIYGLLFISTEPLTQEALTEKLHLSKGSASQGLKMLRAIGAVKAVYAAGDRRDHYTAETELKKLALGFVREQVTPRMESGGQRLQRLEKLVVDLPGGESSELRRARLQKLTQWYNRSREIAPVLASILE